MSVQVYQLLVVLMGLTMAVNNAQLIISPVIRQYFTDPNTLLPVVGTIEFFKLDKITPKNIFQQNGVGDFIVAANPVTLDISGAIPFVPYLYPFDENDETVEELYYIEVRRTDTSLVFALDNFPQNFKDGGGSNITNEIVINKCPSYGFDNPILGNTYTATSENQIPSNWATDLDNGVRPAQGWLWQLEDVSNSEFYYEVSPILAGTLPGNPLYLMTLSTGNTDTQTKNDWSFRLGSGNELKDTIINYQLFLQDNLSNLSTLEVFVFSGKKLDYSINNPINVGSFAISSSLELQTVSFTMPDLANIIQDTNDPTWLIIRLPLSSTYSISMTGTYNYWGDNALIERLPLSYGLSQSRQIVSNNDSTLYNSKTSYLASDLPLTLRQGAVSPLAETGKIFIAASTWDGQAANANLLDDTTLVRSVPILNTLGGRFIDQANLSQFAGNRFLFSNPSGAAFDIQTQDIAPSFTPWVSNTPSITINQTTAGTNLLSSVIDGGNPNKITVTFSNDFNANSESNFYIESTNTLTSMVGTYESRVINNMVGLYSIFADGYFLGASFAINGNLSVTNVQDGSGATPAICDIEFSPTGFSNAGSIQSGTQTGSSGSAVTTLYRNYLTFNSSTISIDPPVPEYVFNFLVDGAGDKSLKGSTKTFFVQLDGGQINSGTYLASQLNDAINGGSTYSIEVVSMPTNGDDFSISTSNETINIVMFDTAALKPAKPNNKIPTIFIEYQTTQTLADIATAIVNGIGANTGAIPTAKDLSLDNPPANLSYFVNL